MAAKRVFTTLFALLLAITVLNDFGPKAVVAADKPTARASHILVPTETECDEIVKELEAADDLEAAFARLAKERSKCPSSRQGGDLGSFGRGQMVPEFDMVAFEKPVGEVHKVKTQFGWHLVLITDRSGMGDELSNLDDGDEDQDLISFRLAAKHFYFGCTVIRILLRQLLHFADNGLLHWSSLSIHLAIWILPMSGFFPKNCFTFARFDGFVKKGFDLMTPQILSSSFVVSPPTSATPSRWRGVFSFKFRFKLEQKDKHLPRAQEQLLLCGLSSGWRVIVDGSTLPYFSLTS
ncbi:hypothetical protein PC118_g13247 [Phytophthora cactorum]|uniref:Peptidyl-prolyl cis-trans isomerase C n=1 Tax=Phytophthora cactorum TaxID=29920 RepID=A0A8T1FT41_9STRA|nr:hypothetical protein PC118_g13247 [Phytophthora cactorum]